MNVPLDRHYAKLWNRYLDNDACPTCGLSYVREIEENRRAHRARHRQVLQVYEPKPVPSLAKLYAKHGTFVPVDYRTPLALRRRMENMGLMFKREQGYDFPPYEANDYKYSKGPACHWLIVSLDGRPIGGMSAAWREYSNAPARWVWAWVWIVPSERKSGWMLRCWDMIREQIPGLNEPERPLSIPAARFFVNRRDVPDYVRAHSVKVIATPESD